MHELKEKAYQNPPDAQDTATLDAKILSGVYDKEIDTLSYD